VSGTIIQPALQTLLIHTSSLSFLFYSTFPMHSITAKELWKLLQEKADVQLIDVREPAEHEAFNIGGKLIPMGEVIYHADEIEKEKPVIVYCRKGIRSQIAIQRLQEKFSFNNLYNLIGGTEAWKTTVKIQYP
jgi:rhodanese-related sulfurtransferase